MRTVGYTQKGKKSELNEDAFLVLVNQKLFVVADGVGGGPSGHAASRAFVDECAELSKKNLLTCEIIENCFQNANTKVHSLAMQSGQQGMASTLVAAYVDKEGLHVFHAGDSRAYRLRDGRVEKLTNDHSKIVQREGVGEKALVTRAIGIRSSIAIEYSKFDWQPNDILALMSDGISDALADEDIETVLRDSTLSMYDKARTLCRDSENRGGQDDKTVVLVS